MLLHFDCKRNLFTFFHTFLGHNFDYLFEIKFLKNQANGRLRVVLQIPKAIELTPIYENQFKIKVTSESKYLENECLHCGCVVVCTLTFRILHFEMYNDAHWSKSSMQCHFETLGLFDKINQCTCTLCSLVKGASGNVKYLKCQNFFIFFLDELGNFRQKKFSTLKCNFFLHFTTTDPIL